MIQTICRRNARGKIISIEISGHAQAGPTGSDIVCAAISALAFGMVNSVQVLAHFEPIVEADEEQGGHLYVELLKTEELDVEQMQTAQILLESFCLSVSMVVAEYPANVNLVEQRI